MKVEWSGMVRPGCVSHLGMVVKRSAGVPEGFRGSRTGGSDSVFIINITFLCLGGCCWSR